MILTKLKDFAEDKERMTLPPAMYAELKIRYLVDINLDGTLRGKFIPLGGDTKATKRGNPYTVPFVGRTVGIKPKLLADSAEYVLGISRPDSKPDRVAECHRQFKELICQCWEVTQDPKLQAIQIFLNSWEPSNLVNCLPAGFNLDKFDASDNITFQVDGEIVANSLSNNTNIEQFWAKLTSGEGDEVKDNSSMMTCLITGEEATVAQRMPLLIKGLIGGQPSGTALVSANSDPFTSYGLKNSLTSPISRDAAEKFAKALNYLLSDDRHRMYIGSTAYVFWTKEKTEFNPISFFKNPDIEDVKNLLASPFSASQMYGVESQDFYALSLTASMARSVVRDWLETTIDNVHGNLKQWFNHQKIVNNDGEIGKPLSIYALAASVYRDPGKEMQSTVPTALIRHALHGSRLADDLLVKLVRRNRAEQDITYPRAVFIKIILISQGKIAMSEMESLNLNPQLEGQEKAAYHCGRLLAELEAVQRSALGNINASLVDRYYGAASSTPAKAFSPLLRGVQSHLGKLRKNAPGINKLREEQLEEIMSHFNEGKLPNTLNVGSQAIFALGYYHQRAANRAAMNAAKAAKALKANA
jgi:CRISPR-associated protein Csd1